MKENCIITITDTDEGLLTQINNHGIILENVVKGILNLAVNLTDREFVDSVLDELNEESKSEEDEEEYICAS